MSVICPLFVRLRITNYIILIYGITDKPTDFLHLDKIIKGFENLK